MRRGPIPFAPPFGRDYWLALAAKQSGLPLTAGAR
jgi:hypothetical protein